MKDFSSFRAEAEDLNYLCDYPSQKGGSHSADPRFYSWSGSLFDRGDIVESLKTGMVGEVHRCGANHLICVTESGAMFKCFVSDVRKV